MQRPTWATVIGVLGIIIGCLGILGGTQAILMPKTLKLQKQMLSEFEEMARQEEPDSTTDQNTEMQKDTDKPHGIPKDPIKIIEKMIVVPEWFQTWSVFSGITKILIHGFYILAAILLLRIKSSGIRLLYGAAGSSIVLNIMKCVVAVSVSAFISISMILGAVFGTVIDIVLIMVVATGDKESFYQVPPPING